MFHVVKFDRHPNQPLVVSHPSEGPAIDDAANRSGVLVASEEALVALETITNAQLVELHNYLAPPEVKQVKKFESRAAAARRCWALLDRKADPGQAFAPLPNMPTEREVAIQTYMASRTAAEARAAHEGLAKFNLSHEELSHLGAVKSATDMYIFADGAYTRQEAARKLTALKAAIPTDQEIETIMGTKDKAEKASKTKTAKTAEKKDKGEKKPRVNKAAQGKPAGKVADLRPVRAGSARAKVLELVDSGKFTAAEIGAKLDMTASYVMAHCYCTSRDSGIGYKVGADGKLSADYPGSKTLADCIKSADEPKEKPAKKAGGKKKAAAAASENGAAA